MLSAIKAKLLGAESLFPIWVIQQLCGPNLSNFDRLPLVYDPNHYFGLCPKLKPKLAVTVTNTETTLQMKTLVAHSMGYFSHYKRAPKPKFAAKY